MDLLNRTIFKWVSKVIPLQWRTLAKVWNEKEKQQLKASIRCPFYLWQENPEGFLNQEFKI